MCIHKSAEMAAVLTKDEVGADVLAKKKKMKAIGLKHLLHRKKSQMRFKCFKKNNTVNKRYVTLTFFHTIS